MGLCLREGQETLVEVISQQLRLQTPLLLEFFFDLMPRRVQVLINFLVLLLVLGLFIMIIWQVCMLGYSFQSSGEHSPTAYIPLYPFAYAVALAGIPVCLVLIQEFLKALKQKEEK